MWFTSGLAHLHVRILMYSPDTDVYNIVFCWPLLPTTRYIYIVFLINTKKAFVNNLQTMTPTWRLLTKRLYLQLFECFYFIWVWLHFIYFWVWKVSHFRHILPVFWIYYLYPNTRRNVMGEEKTKKVFHQTNRNLVLREELTSFCCSKNTTHTIQLYNYITGHTEEDQHQKWYSEIRGIVSDHICTQLSTIHFSCVRTLLHVRMWAICCPLRATNIFMDTPSTWHSYLLLHIKAIFFNWGESEQAPH